MPIKLFSAQPWAQTTGLTVIRIIVGIFMIYHGQEIFDKNKMNEYVKWMTELKFSNPAFTAYLGKGIELVGGIGLAAGLFTRVMAVLLAITMIGISFTMGKGRIFMEDQHPFLFALLALVFFFTGPGKFSLDHLMFKKK